MKKMQRQGLKFVAAFLVLLFFSCSPVFSQVSSFRLRTADSLFQVKRYTQSFEHYEQILRQKQFTPAMLLKMAFIQEGLGHRGGAMYYLNLYYLATHDKTVLDKMQELAKQYNLEGYETSDDDNFWSFYHDHHLEISIALMALLVLALSFLYYIRTKLKERPVVSFISLMVFAGAFFVHLYYGQQLTTAIVTNPSTYIMSGPSAAAPVVEIIGDGHRIEIIGHNDVWTRIRWDGNIAFVKENALRKVEL